ARALASNPHFVLLDEPFGALDAITRSKLQLWLLDVVDQQDKTFLMVSHDIDEALLMSDRIVVMAPNPGRVIEEVVVPVIPKKSHQALLEPEVLNLKRRILSLLANQEQVA
ncbi:MAG: ABC transporter ATP-binding protein, partial [Dehalococcoidia bacterium]